MQKYTTVPEFLADLDAAKLAQVELLRTIIMAAHPGLTEHIKWNAPSYVLDGEDRVTFNLRNKEDAVTLVLHMGATRPEDKKAAPIMPDDEGLITWQSDIRGVVACADLADIQHKQAALHRILVRWLAIA